MSKRKRPTSSTSSEANDADDFDAEPTPAAARASLSPSSSPEHALLLARQLPDQSDDEVRTSLQELTQLLLGLGIRVRDTLVQKRSASSSTVIGQGKMQELAALVADHQQALGNAPLLVFDGELPARQARELEQELSVDVTDRTGVILRVFEGRAGTDLARLELTIARLSYEASRVRDNESVVGRGGGGGGRGARGHSNVVLRKQQVKERIALLRKELERATSARDAQRARRSELQQVALVGYTNAGKSSLLRALTGSDVLVEDKLFATLGTTVRTLSPLTTPRILVSDTVGFLRRLPNELLASFHSTLEEVREADLLLLVVDAADPEWREQLEVTRRTLTAIDADTIATRVLLNKIDRVDDERRAALLKASPGAIALSAHSPDDVRALREIISGFFEERMVAESLVVPFSEQKLLSDIRAHARVLQEEFDDDAATIALRARPEDLARWRKALGR